MKQIFYIASKIHTPQPNFENIYNKIIWFLLNFNNLKAIKYKKKYLEYCEPKLKCIQFNKSQYTDPQKL